MIYGLALEGAFANEVSDALTVILGITALTTLASRYWTTYHLRYMEAGWVRDRLIELASIRGFAAGLGFSVLVYLVDLVP